MSPTDTPPDPPKKNPLEWTIFGLSLAILAGVLGILAHEALTGGDEPARLVLELGTPLADHDPIRIPIRVTNEGDHPAIDVRIEVRGTADGETLRSEVSFDYVSARSTRAGWVGFPGETIPSALRPRVVGYTDP
ncbi:MAG: hypothetical protein GXX91_10490 [Verrucomicrobiaceae bacterium]|nr:hypothetical protein [Verrucomicrobiaceae bacterium]